MATDLYIKKTFKGFDPNFEVNIFVIVIIVFKCYPNTNYLLQGSCFICSDLKFEHFISKLESQPLI